MEQTQLIIERTINAPSNKVWEALTDIHYLKRWAPFFPDFKPVVGFETQFALGKDAAHQYLHICKVLDVVEGQKIRYTWKYEGHPGESFVTYELFPEGNTTKLVLTHTITEAFGNNPDFALSNFKEGWTSTADTLKEFVEKENATHE